MLSKRYESTEFDRRTWLHVPSGTHCPTSSDTHQVVEIQIETIIKMFTQFFNRIKFTIWIICAFRVLNPHQWSWVKQKAHMVPFFLSELDQMYLCKGSHCLYQNIHVSYVNVTDEKWLA